MDEAMCHAHGKHIRAIGGRTRRSKNSHEDGMTTTEQFADYHQLHHCSWHSIDRLPQAASVHEQFVVILLNLSNIATNHDL